MRHDKKKPLYRKQNKKCFMYRESVHRPSYERKDPTTKMNHNELGYDYTPLYKFLISKVGQNYDEVIKEAESRVLHREHIFYLFETTNRDICRLGESSYYSALTVDDNGNIQKRDPNLSANDLVCTCTCCTITFNGVPTKNKALYGTWQYSKFEEEGKIML